MKFVEPNTTVDHTRLMQRVSPLGNERFGSVSERLNYVFRFSQVWGLVQYHRDPRCHLKQ